MINDVMISTSSGTELNCDGGTRPAAVTRPGGPKVTARRGSS